MLLAVIVQAVLLVFFASMLAYQSYVFDRRLVRLLDINRQEREGLLARISTEHRLELLPTLPEYSIDPDERRYIPDTPDGDDAWNDLRKVPEDER